MKKCVIGGVEVKVGQVWINSCGDFVTIKVTNSPTLNFPITDSDGYGYTESGNYFKQVTSCLDLVILFKDV